MKRIIWRTKKLDAFSISIDELEGLCLQLQQEFGNANNVRISIEFKFSDENLVFDSIEDIRNHDIVCNKVTKFSISMFGDKGHIRLDSCEVSFTGPDAVIRSSSDKESWCAGVNEATVSYLKRYRIWYYLILRRAIRIPIILMPWFGLYPFLRFLGYNLTSPINSLISPINFLIGLALLLFWPLIFICIFNVLPSGIVKIRHQNRDIKTVAIACATVIGVIIAAISLIISM